MARWGGKTDDAELIELCTWIRKRFGLEQHGIWRDHFLLIDQRTGSYRVEESLSESDTRDRIIHRPDIIIHLGHPEEIVVIEVDGSIHGWKHVKRKTARRNQHYQDCKVQHIILDKADLKSVNLTVKEALELQLPKYIERAFDPERVKKHNEDYANYCRSVY